MSQRIPELSARARALMRAAGQSVVREADATTTRPPDDALVVLERLPQERRPGEEVLVIVVCAPSPLLDQVVAIFAEGVAARPEPEAH